MIVVYLFSKDLMDKFEEIKVVEGSLQGVDEYVEDSVEIVEDSIEDLKESGEVVQDSLDKFKDISCLFI